MRSLVLALLALVAATAATPLCGQVKKNPMSAAFVDSPEVQAVIRAKRGANQTGEALLGGTYAKDGSWPWTVSICLKDWFGTCNLRLAGSIISDRWVVASYSELDKNEKPTNWYVRAGSTAWKSGGQYVQVEEIWHVTGADTKYHDDDIALVHLGMPLTFNDYVQPICLLSNDDGMIDPDAHDKGWFVGWGHTSGSDFATQEKSLVQAKFPIVDNKVCANKYKNFNSKTNLCAGAGSTTACNYDQGGPLMQEKNGVWYLLGIEANNIDFGKCDSATIFTRASQYCWFFSGTAGVSCI